MKNRIVCTKFFKNLIEKKILLMLKQLVIQIFIINVFFNAYTVDDWNFDVRLDGLEPPEEINDTISLIFKVGG